MVPVIMIELSYRLDKKIFRAFDQRLQSFCGDKYNQISQPKSMDKNLKNLQSTSKKEGVLEDQYLCVVVHKYIYRNVYVLTIIYCLLLLTVCRDIRQTSDANMRQLL
jgi:hypothetical protein